MVYDDLLRNPDGYDFTISTLGEPSHLSPVKGRDFVTLEDRIAFSSQIKNIFNQIHNARTFPSFEKAGPREKIFHSPVNTRVAIVTCGGLCPGLNNVIKGLVNALESNYGIHNVLGIKYGFKGLIKNSANSPISLNKKIVDEIHKEGGTILGSSRGNQDPVEMVNQLINLNIDILFTIGGDGTLRGAKAIADEIKKRELPIGVIGIPKTIDNDLGYVEKTFGFETSVHIASEIITCAHNEARGADNGVGIVRLMGRDSGFIAAAASLANSVVDFCLIPEVEFSLTGKSGLYSSLAKRLDQNRSAVIVVAEGAGQDLIKDVNESKDASGNVLKNDIGLFLKEKLTELFSASGKDVSIRYLNPSYHIRSVAAVASDAIFCYQLAENAVHAAMAGKTNLLIGHWNNFFTHVPITLATEKRRKVDISGALWTGVLSSTQQNIVFK